MHIREGQFVKAGELLFTLDGRTDEANLNKARAQLAKDEAGLADAQRQLARSRELFAQNFVSQGAVDANQSQVESQTAVIAADKAPGVVDTDMQVAIRASGINPVSKLPRESLAPASEPARAIAWLCTPAADALAGQELDVRNPDLRAAVGASLGQEALRLLGLDHATACHDLMSYEDCGAKSFVDTSSACGEFEERTCDSGKPTQNSYRKLVEAVGLVAEHQRHVAESGPPDQVAGGLPRPFHRHRQLAPPGRQCGGKNGALQRFGQTADHPRAGQGDGMRHLVPAVGRGHHLVAGADAQRPQRQPGAQRAAGHRHAVPAAQAVGEALLEVRHHAPGRQPGLAQRGGDELQLHLADVGVAQQQAVVGQVDRCGIGGGAGGVHRGGQGGHAGLRRVRRGR